MISLQKRLAHCCSSFIQADDQETALAAHEKIMADMRDEVAYLKEQESTTIKVS